MAISSYYIEIGRIERYYNGNLDKAVEYSKQALEIARRAGVKLVAYHLIKKIPPIRRRIKKIIWKFEPPEYTFSDYLYEFTL